MKRVAILGASGSIGTQTLDLLRGLPERFEIVLLGGHQSGAALATLAREFPGARTALSHPQGVESFLAGSPLSRPPDFTGPRACSEALLALRPDLVVHGIAGAAGLEPSLAALEAGADLALANKESLVMAGALLRRRLADGTGRLIPVDSEHAAVWQCLAGKGVKGVRRIFLTASGGPLIDLPPEEREKAQPAQVLRHPTWKMGPRISVGSATLMNKAFEVIEAHWLFDLAVDQIEVLIHRQSVVHAMVEFVDGSILAQLGVPDMRVPILAALGWPERIPSNLAPFDPVAFSRLTFEPVEAERHPALALARQVLEMGGDAGAALNAADEVATGAFLAGKIPFPRIVETARAVLASHEPKTPHSLEEVLSADRQARERAWRHLESC